MTIYHPKGLDQADEEIQKAQESGPRALWHLARAVSILVAYLRERENR